MKLNRWKKRVLESKFRNAPPSPRFCEAHGSSVTSELPTEPTVSPRGMRVMTVKDRSCRRLEHHSPHAHPSAQPQRVRLHYRLCPSRAELADPVWFHMPQAFHTKKGIEMCLRSRKASTVCLSVGLWFEHLKRALLKLGLEQSI
jgi:hypothetical protein